MTRSASHAPETDPRRWSVGWGLCAAWLAAGSTGPLTVSLQVILCYLLLAACLIQARPRFTWRGWTLLAGVGVVLVVASRTAGPTELSRVLTVATTMAFLACGMTGVAGRLMWIGALSVMALGLFRCVQFTVPVVWIASDRLGTALGMLAGRVAGRSLVTGASFGGVDYLVVMFVFCGLWLTLLRPPRRLAALWAVLAICILHGAYLALVAYNHEVSQLLPVDDVPDMGNPYVPPPFSWSGLWQQLIPWNLPLVAALLHTAAAVVLVRMGQYESVTAHGAGKAWERPGRTAAGLAAALAVSMVAVELHGRPSTAGLEGKRFVAYPTGQLDWEVPQHDRYGRDAAGMYGALAWLVESLGGELDVPDQFEAASLESADVVMVLHPDTSLAPEHEELMWQYVRRGGSLLVVTEGFSAANGLARRVNELLEPTSIVVQRDAAASAAVDWWGSTRLLEHAVTAGMDPRRMRCLSDAGASLQTTWPARPLIVGSWGWSAPEQGAAWTDSPAAQGGAKLGDLVLAAEQRLGEGRLIVLGDNTSLTNEGVVDGHALVQQLLAYLSHEDSGWVQAVSGAAIGLGLLVLWLGLWRLGSPGAMVTCCVIFALALAVDRQVVGGAAGRIPDGARIKSGDTRSAGNRLAYIDASHLEPYSLQAWGFDALNGLALNLFRNGYLPLMLHEFSAARLNQAGLLVSIGPARRFSPAEREIVQDFVHRGGVLITLVGAEEADASAALLADFGLRVPRSPVPTRDADPEPEPFGRTRAEYLEVEPGDGEPYRASVRLFAAWPVESLDADGEVLAYGRNTLPVVQSEAELPVIMQRAFGEGQVVVIGDTCFAMNKNLEYIGGQPFFGGHENAHFWRWLLTRVRKEPEWVPPRPPQVATPPEGPDDEREEEDL
ncbi:MAG: hypothetical protein MUF48_09960 [Pirellulaceae bacterium]|nr:hypothetical protein [Pirellulaceae bacterium]